MTNTLTHEDGAGWSERTVAEKNAAMGRNLADVTPDDAMVTAYRNANRVRSLWGSGHWTGRRLEDGLGGAR